MKKKLVLTVCVLLFVAVLLIDWFMWTGGWPTISQTLIWAETKCPIIFVQVVFLIGFLIGHWMPL